MEAASFFQERELLLQNSPTPGEQVGRKVGCKLREAQQEHSGGLHTGLLAASSVDGLGLLPMFTQVLLHHLVVLSTATAILGELDTCSVKQAAVGLGWPALLPCSGPWGDNT